MPDNGKRYRYYISRSLITESGSDHGQGWRLPAYDIEDAVITSLRHALDDPAFLVERIGSSNASADQIRTLLDDAGRIAKRLNAGPAPEHAQAIRDLVERIVIRDDALTITLRRSALSNSYTGDDEDPVRLTVPVQFRRRGVEMKLVIADRTNKPSRLDPALIKSVARAHLWFDDLATGRVASLQAIAEREGITEGYVRRLIPLAFLAPDIVEAVLQGEQPVDLTAARLTSGIELPLDWSEQRQLLDN